MKEVFKTFNAVTHNVEAVAHTTDSFIQPVRVSVFKRFPIISVLCVTFGVTATLLGAEHLIDGIPLFKDHPSLMLLAGIFVLTLTGKVYQKLG